MMKSLIAAVLLLAMPAGALAETASEVPLENPEVLEPPSRPQGDVPSADPQLPGKGSAAMTPERMREIVTGLDQDANFQGNLMQLKVGEVPITIIIDPSANRMRAFSPFRSLDGIDGQSLYRMMQANFDSALDARYAIARGYVISVYIHPLSELKKNQFIEGLGQVANLVRTYGTAYTSGAITYGGGDSRNLHRELIEELLKKGERI